MQYEKINAHKTSPQHSYFHILTVDVLTFAAYITVHRAESSVNTWDIKI